MAAKHTLHVALTEPLTRYVGERVASGEYATASEVVRTGLRLLIERDQAKTEVRADRTSRRSRKVEDGAAQD